MDYTLVFGLVATTFAVFLARAIAWSLPFREMPLHNPLLHFQLPYHVKPEALIGWSSFPSDHAVVSFCMAAILWFVSRRLGACAIGYAVLISIPRIYLGFCYPTDILGGALLGTGVVSLSQFASLRWTVSHIFLDYLNPRPAYKYGFLFICTFEIGEMYGSLTDAVAPFRIPLRYSFRWRIEEVVPLLVLGLLCAATCLKWRKYKTLGGMGLHHRQRPNLSSPRDGATIQQSASG